MKKFFVLWSSQAASMLGSTIVGFALSWYLARETESATILTTSMLVNILPGVVLGPFIGPLIDRWNRKSIIICSDLITALFTAVLVVLFHTGDIQIWHIYLIMAARSTSGAFQGPALSASIPMIVSKEQLVKANGLNMILRGAPNVISPLAGALLIEAFEMHWVLAVDIVTAVIAIGCLLPLVIPQPPRTIPVSKPGYFTDMKQGFRYVSSRRGLLYLILFLAILSFFAAPSNILLPLFVTNYFGGDVLKLGWLQAAGGVGIIAGGLIMGVWSGFRRRIVTTLVCIMVQAVSVFIFAFTTESLFFLAVALRFISGLMGAMLNAPLGAIMQSVVPREMQGRVFALQNSLIGIMMPLSLAIGGPVADVIGLRLIWYLAAAAIFIITGFAFFSRDLMHIEDDTSEENPVSEQTG